MTGRRPVIDHGRVLPKLAGILMKTFLNLGLSAFVGAWLMTGCASSSCCDDGSCPVPTKTAWKPLFDGKSLAGWRAYNKTATPPGPGWVVENGILKKKDKVAGGDIITEKKFNNFELAWEWKVMPGANNGVKYLVTEERPTAPGHEYQMLDDERHPDGKIGPKRQTASFYEVIAPVADRPTKPAGEWNTSRILLQGNHVEHWLNGKKVVEYELGSDAVKAAVALSKFKNAKGFGEKIEGHIMLTDHQDEAWFRNMKIRELPAK